MGYRKQLRNAEKANYAQQHGVYYQSPRSPMEGVPRPTKVSSGVLRAAARIRAKRKANKAIPDTAVITRQQLRAKARRNQSMAVR